MIYYLYDLLAGFDIPGIGMFQYISFRSGAAIILSLLITTAFGKKMIRYLAAETNRRRSSRFGS